MSRPDGLTASATLSALALSRIVEPGVAPAGVLSVAALTGSRARDVSGRPARAFAFAAGAAGMRSAQRRQPVDPTTPFDLASVTKPFVASTAARLVRAGRLTWDAPLVALLPELRNSASEAATLRLLLSHRAGLEAHGALFLPMTEGRAVDAAAALRLAADSRRTDCTGAPPEEGFAPVYSDLGYLLAGTAMARAADEALEVLVEREVTAPLGLDVAAARAWATRDPSFADRVAPTEVVAWRGGEIVGAVHDENAWALTGSGLSGHAGLFGTAESVARFGASVLHALDGELPDWLGAAEIEPLVRPRVGGTLRTGFDGRALEGSSAGERFGPRSFGHLGFTGTSLWCDPDAAVVAVILTNRVSPSRDNVAIRTARPALNDALFGIAGQLASPR